MEKTKNLFVGIKNFFKSLNLYEIIWLSSVVVATILLTIFLPEEIMEDDTSTLTIICSVIAILANPLCELMISKQNSWNFIVSIVFIEITEAIVYFSLGIYISAVVSLAFWIPIDLFSFIDWWKHPDKQKEEITKVRKLNLWASILSVFCIVAFGFGVGYLLQLIGEEESYIDAFVSAVGMANGILLLLRFNEQWYAWLMYLLLDGALWIMSGHYIMLITTVAMLINTIYGFFKWIIYIKNTKKQTDL